MTDNEFEPLVGDSSQQGSDVPSPQDDKDVWDEAKRAVRVSGPLTWIGLAEHVKHRAADRLKIGAGLPLKINARQDHPGVLSRLALRVSGFTPAYDAVTYQDPPDYLDHDYDPAGRDDVLAPDAPTHDEEPVTGNSETDRSQGGTTLPQSGVPSQLSETDPGSPELSILYQDILNLRRREPLRRPPPSRRDGRRLGDRGAGNDVDPAD